MTVNPLATALVIFAAAIASTANVFAQNAQSAANPKHDPKKHELRVGAGIFSSNDLIDTYSDITSTALTGEMYSVSDEKASGNYSLTYRHRPKSRLSFGFALVYSRLDTDMYSDEDYSGKSLNNYFTIAPEIEYKYINRKNFKMYGFVGAGVTLNRQEVTEPDATSTSNSWYFNFQATLIGVQLGHNLGIYAEGGFGYKGIASIGVFGSF